MLCEGDTTHVFLRLLLTSFRPVLCKGDSSHVSLRPLLTSFRPVLCEGDTLHVSLRPLLTSFFLVLCKGDSWHVSLRPLLTSFRLVLCKCDTTHVFLHHLLRVSICALDACVCSNRCTKIVFLLGSTARGDRGGGGDMHLKQARESKKLLRHATQDGHAIPVLPCHSSPSRTYNNLGR